MGMADLSIKTDYPRYRDPHIKDSRDTVLSLTWASLYGLDIFMLRRPTGVVANPWVYVRI